MSSNTASSSARVAGSADFAAPRRNSKKPKCNFFSKDLIFMVFFFFFWWSFGSIHEYPLANLLSFHMGFAWEVRAWEWGVSLRGKTMRGMHKKEKRNKKPSTSEFRSNLWGWEGKKNVGEAWAWRAWYLERQREWAWLLELSESEAERARQRGEIGVRTEMRVWEC